MANEKDIAEKTLQSLNDVFADIANVLLFHGQRRIKEEELEQARSRSAYTGEKRLREQERDEAKFWHRQQIRISLIGLENETRPEPDLPLRVIGYDGAGYRDQLYSLKGKNGKYRRNRNKRYPVVTMVLYFGYEKRWNQARTLYEVIGKGGMDEELRPYVNDYKINLFEIAWLTDEQVDMFQSDFRIVADYFVQMRKMGTYNGSKENIVHVQEVLNLMTYLTKDNRFREAYEEERKGEGIHNMCEVLDRIEARGRSAGLEEGRKEGHRKGLEEGQKEGLSAMITALKAFLVTPEEIWNVVIKNEPYQNVTLQQVKKYF
ncbi:MAG: Rpn family recombination-promoting nuclease/putative transposase [Lachnospiraceae bacterium]|nr:Rpn family recombination-promoting nuclease/putative transposase [Lachnospiraceae bacterium]